MVRMKTPTKFVKPLTTEQREQLSALMKSAATQRTRMRAHAVLLSERRYSLEQIADIYQVDRDRVSQWLEWWEAEHVAGLDDGPRSGRPPKLTESERQEALTIALQEPRTIKTGLKRIADEIGKLISGDTLRTLLNTERYVWKRMRRSTRERRDEAEFRAAEAELAQLRATALGDKRPFDLWYYDEAGFTLQPSIPYAWQRVGHRLELASAHGPRQNILGFFNLHNQFHSFAFQGTIDSHTVIHCFDLFRQQQKTPALIVVDNAPIHTSEDFEDELERWQKDDLHVKFLPPYCPELNLIEILWRKIKYEWLPLDAYQNFKTLTASLFDVLKGIGSKYRITFA
jgi:transposase